MNLPWHAWAPNAVWTQAAGTYARGNEPRQGAVMAFAGTRGMPMGHVAVVKKIVNDREILIDHANWSPINGRRGQIEDNVRTLLCNLVRPLCLHIRSLNAAGVCIGGACYLVARLLV